MTQPVLPRADQRWSTAMMQQRLVRYADLRPCRNAFIDTRTPGSEAKENFTIIGPGVSENPQQHVHIPEPHGFNIGGARQPPHCVNSQHSHQTAEVFVVHSGEWTINLGETGDHLRMRAGPGDVISVPTGLFRGFSNVGTETGFLWVVLGGDDPGHVLWAPHVFDVAKDYGLVLLDNGQLIDTALGETVPAGASPMPRTTAQQVAALHIPSADEAQGWHVAEDKMPTLPQGSLAGNGVTDATIIGAGGPLAWPHGFSLSRVTLAAGAHVTRHRFDEPEVLFCHQGEVTLHWDDGALTLGSGDTLTVPPGLSRHWSSVAGAHVFVVRGDTSREASA
jgi:quercetin dioxygenase-like cupin family protein